MKKKKFPGEEMFLVLWPTEFKQSATAISFHISINRKDSFYPLKLTGWLDWLTYSWKFLKGLSGEN